MTNLLFLQTSYAVIKQPSTGNPSICNLPLLLVLESSNLQGKEIYMYILHALQYTGT